jgi:predicted ester cyclase
MYPMEPKQVAEEFLAAFNSEDMAKSRAFLSDEFTFSGPTPEPVSADQWMGIVKGMRAAFPDLNYNIKITGSDDNKVMTSTQLTGTHSSDWDLTAMGIGVIPATGKAFSNPKEEGMLTIEDGKITSYFINSKEESGIPGMLKQLGIEVPA